MSPTLFTSLWLKTLDKYVAPYPAKLSKAMGDYPTSCSANSLYNCFVFSLNVVRLEALCRLEVGAAVAGSLITLPIDIILTVLLGIGAGTFSAMQSDRFYEDFYLRRDYIEALSGALGSYVLILFRLRFYSLEVEKLENLLLDPAREARGACITEYNELFKEAKAPWTVQWIGACPLGEKCFQLNEDKTVFIQPLTLDSPFSRWDLLSSFPHAVIRRVNDLVYGAFISLYIVFTLNCYFDVKAAQVFTKLFFAPVLLSFDLIARLCQLMKPNWSKETFEYYHIKAQ